MDPNGVAVAQTTGTRLSFAVGLATLDRSRDAAGKVRQWTLEVVPQGAALVGLQADHVEATVIGPGRITLAALRSRIDTILGPNGSFLKIYGEDKDGEARLRLEVNDIVAAETIDMHGLLDGVLGDVEQDGGVDPRDFRPFTAYTLFSKKQDLGYTVSLHLSSLRVGAINVAIGPGVMLGPSIPAVHLGVAVTGSIKLEIAGVTLATAKLRGGKFDCEVGLTLSPDGVPMFAAKATDSPLDIDISTAAKATLLLLLGIGGLIGGMSVTEWIEHELNEVVAKTFANLSRDTTTVARILMLLFGAHLSYKPFRIEGDSLLFEHIAPLEPDLQPTPGYAGAIGRSVNQLGPTEVQFLPHTLGDTWRNDNLRKIDHIVVVMMENRSYDHVLGYRARAPINDGADGLVDGLIAAVEAAPGGPYDVRPLSQAGFPPNAAGLKTRLPKSVPHELEDVQKQLALRAPGPNGRTINSPKGFVDEFIPRIGSDPMGVVPNDVLGYYEAADLPFYAYLAENYAYSDHYFCAHPGPTLPNRMYSLTGDVQHDRYDFPLLDNNNSDNFLLSRATTIYDVLARKGLGFRVYESTPSVTMLRMFARYASDNVNIVPLDRLAADVARGDLPAFTAIEPQMHAHPEDDDHPDADMHRGQQFIKRIYDTLTSNQALWQKT
ncbi:MAG: hypothetical protein KC457_28815, partial [Myxococcales bacterium]|nr:hypothetical protein [Myxococcales bacterium]